MTRTNSTAPGGQEGEGSSRRPSPTSRRRPSTTYKKRPANLDCYTCDMALNIVARKVEVQVFSTIEKRESSSRQLFFPDVKRKNYESFFDP